MFCKKVGLGGGRPTPEGWNGFFRLTFFYELRPLNLFR